MKLSLIRCPLALFQHLRLDGKMALIFLSQCQLGRGFTLNFAEFHFEPLLFMRTTKIYFVVV